MPLRAKSSKPRCERYAAVRPSFDLLTDKNFLNTLLQIGEGVPDEYFDAVEQISATMDWDLFCAAHSWRRHDVDPIDSYPGSPQYYTFIVTLPSCRVRTYGFLLGEANIVCAVGCEIV